MPVDAAGSRRGLWSGFVRAAGSLRHGRATPRTPEPLDEAIDLAERLLLFAEEAGKEVPADVVKSLVDAKTALDKGAIDDATKTAFCAALGTLSTLTGQVTLQSVSPAARASALKTKRRHRWLGILLLVALVPISSVNLAGQIFLKDADQKIAEVCEAEKTALDCQRLAVNPGQAYQDKLLVGGGTMQIWNDLWWLNVFELFVSTGDIDKVYLRDTIEDQFFEAVWAAHLVETRFVSFYISFLGSLLPLIYALLGTVAFGIRDLRRRVADNTWTVAQELSATLRLLLAFFVGVVIGLFGDWTRGTSLSPIAIAFLAGYGVESFFDFLDGILKAFGKGGAAGAEPAK